MGANSIIGIRSNVYSVIFFFEGTTLYNEINFKISTLLRYQPGRFPSLHNL